MSYKFLLTLLTPEDVKSARKAVCIGKKQASNIINGKSNNARYLDLLLVRYEQRKKQLERAMEWQQEVNQLAKQLTPTQYGNATRTTRTKTTLDKFCQGTEQRARHGRG